MNDRMASTMSGLRWMAAMVLAAAVTQADGQQSDFVLPRLTPGIQLSRPGDLATILLAQSALAAAADSTVTPAVRRSIKSPKRAFLMSMLVPGSGEFWAGAKKRAALFFGLEVIGLTVRSNWDGKGDDLEDDFILDLNAIFTFGKFGIGAGWETSDEDRDTARVYARWMIDR